jgi:predicted signal transduction protein with EAL and GGDEF domain
MNGGVQSYFVVRAIPGTTWQVVISVPGQPVRSISGTSQWIPWALYFAFVLVRSMPCGFFHSANSRAQQTRLYSELDRVARLDGLTDVYNRRQLDEDLTRVGQASTRTVGRVLSPRSRPFQTGQ